MTTFINEGLLVLFMNKHPSSIRKYPKLEKILEDLGVYDSRITSKDMSARFTRYDVGVFRDLIFDAHDDEFRKHSEGDYYIEEHLAEVMQWGQKLKVPPCAIVAYGLHDFREDHTDRFSLTAEKEHLIEANNGKLDQQVNALQISPFDKNIILNVTYLMVKPSLDEMGVFLEGVDDRRFKGKIFGCLGEDYWVRELPQVIKGVNKTQRFYAGVGLMLDMYSNGNSSEKPKENTDLLKFFNNQKRNTARMFQMGRLVDDFIRSHDVKDHIYFDMNEYNNFINNFFVPRFVKGAKKFNLELDSSTKNYWEI